MKPADYLKGILSKTISQLSQTQILYLLSFAVGLLCAVAASVLKNIIHFTAEFVAVRFSSGIGMLFYFVVPFTGVVLTFFLVRYIIKDNINHGISRVLYAISQKKSYLKARNIWTTLIAGAITIGFGGSVGAEAPIVHAGSSIGSTIGRLFKLNYRQITLLLGCGAAGAISGIFKAPIAGIVFTLEVLMLDLTLSSIIPLLISSVTAATVAWMSMGEKVLFSFEIKEPFIIMNVPWYIILGIFTGLVSVWFSKMTLLTEQFYSRINKQYIRLILGGLTLGLLVFLFPPFFGEGYTTVMSLLKGNNELLHTFFTDVFPEKWWSLLAITGFLMLLKVFATSSTNAAGGIGGVFAPVLFTGAIAGYFAVILITRFTTAEIPDSRFILTGMAGLMAGVMQAPLTAIFLIAEISGGYDLLIPLIISSTVSFITSRGFIRYSIYHIQLASRGELITHDKDKAILLVMDWTKDIETDLVQVKPDDTLRDLVKAISRSCRNIFPVVDEYGILEGVVLLDDVREIMFNTSLYDKMHVGDIMNLPPSYIDKSENMEAVMNTFSKTGAWNLPVLDKGKYIGFISKARIFSTYREILI
ncbi:MAG: chloride channel protein, partial [Bacteroidales bacterium]